MDLSIIIPCHNLENYITPLLDSLKAQKSKYSVEHIFVLDDCSDDTRGVIERSGIENYSIMTCCVHSCGLARNIGLVQAKGDYIWFVDGDDWILGIDNYDLILDNIKAEHADRLRIKWKSNGYELNNPSMVWQHIFSREFLHGLSFSAIQPDEDQVFFNQVLAKEKATPGLPPVRFINQEIYFYNYNRPGSNTTQFNETGSITYSDKELNKGAK